MASIRRFTDLRAWNACYEYKRAVYRVCRVGPLATAWELRRQMERAVAGPPAHLAEGFGRFSPPDFARFAVLARASIMESQNHLIDAVDRGWISEATRQDLNALAETALQEVTGLMEYLQSPEALRNARRARERRAASRPDRRSTNHEPEPDENTQLSNTEPNLELRTRTEK